MRTYKTIRTSFMLGFIALFFVLFNVQSAYAVLPPCNAANLGLLTKSPAGDIVFCNGVAWSGVGALGTGGDFWVDQGGGKIYYDEGFVGVNTSTPKSALDISGSLTSDSTVNASKLSFGSGGITLQDVADLECADASDEGLIRYNSVDDQIEVCDGTSFGSIDGDIEAPFLISTTPNDNDTGVSTTANIILNFNEIVNVDSGYITIFNALDDTVFESIDVSSGNVTGDGTATITVNPTSDLDIGVEYYVNISNSAFHDDENNYFAGIHKDDTLNFITADAVAPTVVTLSPLDNATGVDADTNLVITFSEVIKKGSGNITIHKQSDDSIVGTIPVTSALVTGEDTDTITINPGSNLESNTAHYVLISGTAFTDVAGNNYAGIAATTTWNFTITDTIPPEALAFTPPDESTNVSRTVNLIINFADDVFADTGNINIYRYSDDALIESIDIASGQVTGDGSDELTINPAVTLASEETFYVLIDATALTDDNNNYYPGILDKDVWNFTTTDETNPILLSSNPADNDINVSTDTNITLTFSEPVEAIAGSINVRRTTDDTSYVSIFANDPRYVTGSGTDTITLIFAGGFEDNTEYYLLIPATAFDDLSGNSYAGIASTTALSFTTGDGTPPVIKGTVPADEQTRVSISNNLSITFTENVLANSGNIYIYNALDNSLFEQIDIVSGQIGGLGTNTITINPTSDFDEQTTYYVLMDEGIVTDSSGNEFAGIDDPDIWQFSTIFAASPWVGQTANEQQILSMDILEEGTQLGFKVIIEGDTAVASSVYESAGGTGRGAVYIYTRTDGVWTLDQRITASDGADSDHFGISLGLDGDTLVVGATLVDGAGTDRGAVYSFEKVNGAWVEQQKMMAGDGANTDQFGVSIAIDGDTMVIGANLGDGAFADTGTAYVYKRTNGTWAQYGSKLEASDGIANDRFGSRVSIHGSRIAVGAPGNQTGQNGKAYIFQNVAGTWVEEEIITASDPEADSSYGSCVSISNGMLAVGAQRKDNGGDNNTGSMYVYTYDGIDWNAEQKILPSNNAAGDRTGQKCEIDGNTLIFGASKKSPVSFNEGTAYIYTYNGTTWVEEEIITADTPLYDSRFGFDVDVNDDTAIISAVKTVIDDTYDSGAIYIVTAGDQTDPYIQSSSPENGERFVDVSSNIILNFNENVNMDAGNLVIRKYSDDSAFETIPAGSGKITGDGTSTLTVNPAGTLDANTKYYLDIDAGFVDDGPGRRFAGLSNKDLLNFTTNAWNGTITEDDKITASDGAILDYFGWNAVDIYNDTVVVGAYANDDAGSESGSVYVFTGSDGTWSEQQKLTASDAAAGDRFGWSVAIYEDTIVVGSYWEDDGATLQTGAVYVFTRSGGTWTQQQKLTASDATADDFFGWDVGVYEDTLIASARTKDNGGLSQAGAAYIFTRSGGTWTQQQKLLSSDSGNNDQFGISVAIAKDIVVVGSHLRDEVGNNEGGAYVFTRDGGVWTEQQILTASDMADNDRIARDVDIDGTTIVVSGHQEDPGGVNNAGSAYIFTYDGSTWSEEQKISAPSPVADNVFGRTVNIHGNTAIISEHSDDLTWVSPDTGAFHIFTRNGTTWTHKSKIYSSDIAIDDQLSQTLALHEDQVVIGAWGDDDNGFQSGSAYIFKAR